MARVPTLKKQPTHTLGKVGRWIRRFVVCGKWPGCLHSRNNLHIRWARWGFRRGASTKGFHLHYYWMLPP